MKTSIIHSLKKAQLYLHLKSMKPDVKTGIIHSLKKAQLYLPLKSMKPDYED
jgi:hypothetical protein